MNISKSLALCFLTTVFAFAQFPWEEQQAPATQESAHPASEEASSSSFVETQAPPPAPPPSHVAEAPATEGKTIFDSLRGHAYNPYSTVGAASTVRDLVTLPSDINGQKFFYVSPLDNLLGYGAFPIGGSTFMLGLDNSPLGSPAALILGYANSTFGLALDYSISKIWESNSRTDASTRTTGRGDNIGLYFSLPIGAATVYASLGWLTYGESTSSEVGNYETSVDYSTIGANAGITGNLNALSYDGYLNIVRTGGTQILDNDDKLVDEYTYLGTSLNFNIGYAALQNSTGRLIVGSNNYFHIRFYDKIKTPNVDGDNVMGFTISPNILGEVSLSNNWLVFAGATHAINLIGGNNDKNNNTSYLEIAHTSGTDAFAGTRYQKANWALEAQISGINNNGITFASIGGFIYF